MKTKAKTFVQALNYMGKSVDKGKKFLEDKRLTFQEKSILRALLFLRDNRFEDAIALLLSLTISDTFVEAQRLQALGSAYNNMGDFPMAIKFYEQSLALGESHGIPKQEFHTYYCLFILYLNLHDLRKMKKVFAKLKAASPQEMNETICILTCQYHLQRFKGRLEDSLETLGELELLVPEMSEHQVINFFMDKFDAALALDSFGPAEECLEEMKKFRKFRLSASYQFMRGLLNHYYKDSPIYLVDHEFQEHPILYHQLLVIKNLEEDRFEAAVEHWEELHKMSPGIYLKNFTFQGPLCIFSKCLEKLKDTSNLEAIPSEIKTKEERTIYLLTHASKALSKEKIYHLVYGHQLESKNDLQKLKSLIHLLKTKRNLNIQYKKGCYILVG